MAFEKSNQKLCKLMAKVGCLPIVLWIRHLGEGKINDVMIMWCHVVIADTCHWLLLAMWHANHLINSHMIGKAENQTLPKIHETRFMNEMEHFKCSDRFELWASGIKDGIHARLAGITCRRLEKVATNFLQFPFMNLHDFNFLPELSKNVLSRQFGAFWARVGWETGTVPNNYFVTA